MSVDMKGIDPATGHPLSLASARIAVDNEVGRRVFVWDKDNDRPQMIYGDTGARLVQVANGTAVNLSIRRVGNVVDLTLRDWKHTTASALIYQFPDGFKPDQSPRIGFIGSSAPTEVAVFQVIAGALTQLSAHTDGVFAQLSFTTSDPWPEVLPGTAIGSIPNL